MKKLAVMAVILTVGVVDCLWAASTAYWRDGGSGAFTDPSHWKDGVVPQSGWIMRFDNVRDAVVDDAAMALFKSAEYVVVGADSLLTIANDVPVELQVNGADSKVNYFFVSDGVVRKCGQGKLTFNNGKDGVLQHFVANTGGIEVREGNLEIVTPGNITISAPIGVFGSATVTLPSNAHCTIPGLYGDGTVVNGQSGTSYKLYFECAVRDTPFDFSGTFSGNVMFYGKECYQRFSNAAVVLSGDMYKGYLGTAAFPTTVFRDVAEYEYLGAGETVADGQVFMNGVCYRMTFNGGTRGGLVFDRELYMNAEPQNYATEVIWGGDNAEPCIVRGKFTNVNSDSTKRPVYWKKVGKGTWRFESGAKLPDRKNRGTVAIEEGCVEYDVLKGGYGSYSSLGYATTTHSEYYGIALDTSKAVSYAYLLGNGDNAVGPYTGTLKYIGSEARLDAAKILTRPVALKGAGRFSTSSAALDWTGFTSAVAGENTVVLAGEAAGCIARQLSDGPGRLSVVKEGQGDWTLDGDIETTGSLKSHGGTLKVAGQKYTWYRFSLMENYKGYYEIEKPTSGIDTSRVWVERLAMLDRNGADQVGNLTAIAKGNAAALQPGQCAIESTAFSDWTNYGVENLFRDDTSSFGGNINGSAPVLSDESTWVRVVFRPPVTARPIVAYDLALYAQAGWPAGECRNARSWKIEGSDDGTSWTALVTVVSNKVLTTGMDHWLSNDSMTRDPAKPLGTLASAGSAKYKRPAAVASVGVANGGRLVAEDPLVANGLSVDGALGARGTVDGISLSATPKVYLTNVTKQQLADGIPLDIAGLDGLSNLNSGEVYIDGVYRKNDNARYDATTGKLHVDKKGLCIYVR